MADKKSDDKAEVLRRLYKSSPEARQRAMRTPKFADETYDEFYERLHYADPKAKGAPRKSDSADSGIGVGFGSRYDTDTSNERASLAKQLEAAEAPLRRRELQMYMERMEEAEARKAGKPIKKIYQKGGTVEDKRSERTKRIEETKIEDDFMGIKKLMKAGALKASQLGDKVGFTQEEEYKDKKPVKKKSGGMIKSSASKRADGCAIRGKTRA
jgi:hypothetical protein